LIGQRTFSQQRSSRQSDPHDPSINRAKGDRHELGHFFVILLCGGVFSYYTITINFPIVRRFLTSSSNP
jgi:hypothetical protein